MQELVKKEIPEIPEENILLEPYNRNTAPSITYASYSILKRNPDAVTVVSAADNMVSDMDKFESTIFKTLEYADKHNALMALGIIPAHPDTNFGYIQALGEEDGDNPLRVKTFTEKPDAELAEVFVNSGEFYWNTGLFLSNVRHLQHCFTTLLPVVLQNLDEINPDWTVEEENEFIRDNFPSYPNISMDYGVLEKSEHVYVMKCSFGWADLGTWHSIYETMRKGEEDNVVVNSNVIIDDSRNNIIKLPKEKLAVINGLDGFIVAEEGDILLICKKEDSSALIRKYVNEVRMKKGEEFV